jgi:hypothetical protein
MLLNSFHKARTLLQSIWREGIILAYAKKNPFKKMYKKGNLVHVAPAYAESERGFNHFDSYAQSFSVIS